METIVGFKGSLLGRGVSGIVVGEFSKWEELRPVVLFIVDIEVNILFERVVNSLHLAISLQIIGG